MKNVRHLDGETSLVLDGDACAGCGACAVNCQVQAVTVTPGVGCASYLLAVWPHRLTGRKTESACC